MLLVEALQPLAPELLWILIAAFIIAFLLAFSVGANDVSNSFGTSVGSKVLTVTQACILATFFEVAGATLLGYAVCDTFRKSIYDVEMYKDEQKELMLGALACLIGSATWNMIATALKMPISGTHSIVGATIGFSLVLKGYKSIKWLLILKIVGSWFLSPILAGLISSLIYVVISKTVIRKVDPLKYGLKALPLFYGATIFINVASVLISDKDIIGLNKISNYAGLFLSLVIAAIVITIVALVYVPRLKKQITDELVVKTLHSRKHFSNGKPPSAGPGPARATNISKRPAPTIPLSALTKQLPSSLQKQQIAFDNVAFKSDGSTKLDTASTVASVSVDSDGKKIPPEKPKREITLSPQELMKGNEPLSSKSDLGQDMRPQIAPKPAFLLRRQLATQQQSTTSSGSGQQQQQLEEIDLKESTSVSVVTTNDVQKVKLDIEAASACGNNGDDGYTAGVNGRPGSIRGERIEVFRLFSSLQILTACFASFAHGTNDVSNAVAPLIPIWNIYATGAENVDNPTQVWILLFGGIGICTGLWAWGRAIMGTVGTGLTQLTPSKGFSIELGAAISVLTATKLGLPISTTHCKVGSVVIVGLISSIFCSEDNNLLTHGMSDEEREKNEADKAVDWKLFGNIAITWVVTVPLAAAASALVMLVLEWIVL